MVLRESGRSATTAARRRQRRATPVAEMSAEATGVGDPGRDDERARHETGDARISLRGRRRFDTIQREVAPPGFVSDAGRRAP